MQAGTGDSRFGELTWRPDPSAAAAEFVAPRTQGVHVRLRPVTAADYGALQALELNTELAFRWRFRGATPSPEQWTQSLWRDVLAQHMVVGRRSGRPLGLVMAYRASFQDRHAFVGVASFGSQDRSPLTMLGFGMFIEYVFTCWDFQKLYLQTPEFNYHQFSSGVGRYFELEGRFRNHSFFRGRYWDYLTLAIYRDKWSETGSKTLAIERPKPPRIVRVHIPPLPRDRWK
jgi:hypothetical protein